MSEGNFRAVWIERLIKARLSPNAMLLGMLMAWRVGPHKSTLKCSNAKLLSEINFGKVDRLNAAKRELAMSGLIHIELGKGTEWNTYALVLPDEEETASPNSTFPQNTTLAKSGFPKSGKAGFPKSGKAPPPRFGEDIPYSKEPYSIHPDSEGQGFASPVAEVDFDDDQATGEPTNVVVEARHIAAVLSASGMTPDQFVWSVDEVIRKIASDRFGEFIEPLRDRGIVAAILTEGARYFDERVAERQGAA
jgi:hypothetical protein